MRRSSVTLLILIIGLIPSLVSCTVPALTVRLSRHKRRKASRGRTASVAENAGR